VTPALVAGGAARSAALLGTAASLGIPARAAAQPGVLSELVPGTLVNVGYVASETDAERIVAAQTIAHAGLTPVPHVSARRLPSRVALSAFLDALGRDGADSHLFVVGGDPLEPVGPFADAAAVLLSDELARADPRSVSLGGHPEGHPVIAEPTLWTALAHKARLIRESGRDGEIISQLTLDASAALTWVAEARDRGIDLPIRIGVPGPMAVGPLARYAEQVRAHRTVARLDGRDAAAIVTADDFLAELADGLDPRLHGEVGLHVFALSDPREVVRWMRGIAA
jgi:methylenetetrahydrofolate reductase (NADPH)